MAIHPSAYQTVLTFGKYRGVSLGRVAEIKPDYLSWLESEDKVPMSWRLRAANTLAGNPVEPPTPSDKFAARSNGTSPKLIAIGKEHVGLTFPFQGQNARDVAFKDQLKVAIDGMQWDAKNRYWKAPAVHISRIIDFFGGPDKIVVDDEAKRLQEKELERKRTLNSIRTLETDDFQVPGMKLPLYPRQSIAMRFGEAANWRYYCAYETGEGKTPIAIAQGLHLNAKTLVICEKNVLTQWAKQVQKFAGKTACVWSTDGIEGSKRAQFHIINYDIVARHRWELYKLGFELLVCDEATQLKNYQTVRSMAILGSKWAERKEYPGFKCPYVLFLSATPLPNRPRELFSILQYIDRKRFTNPSAFLDRYGTGQDYDKYRNQDELNDRISDLVIRRKKEQGTGFDRNDVFCTLTKKEILDIEKDTLTLIRKLGVQKKPSASQMPEFREMLFKYKFPRLIAFIDEMLLSDKPVLVYFIHQEHAERVAKHYGDKAVVAHGKHSVAHRDAAKEKLISGEAKVGCFTLIAGGKGMDGLQETLTEVVFVDVWYVPYMHEQAEGRLFRSGQTRPVTAWYLKVPGSIDEMMTDVLIEKLKIIGAVLDGAEKDFVRQKSFFKEVIKRFVAERHLTDIDVDAIDDTIEAA